MSHLRIQRCLLAILIFAGGTSLFAQKLVPKARVIEPDAILSSKIMDKDYQLFISFSRGYSAGETIN